MKKIALLSLALISIHTSSYSQKSSFNIKLQLGPAYADTTIFLASDFSLGYEIKKNRIEFNIQSGSKKRAEYTNGDFADALMTNYTFTYSRLFTKNKFSLIPILGAGYVSGQWETAYYEDNSNNLPVTLPKKELLTGFGLNYGVGMEYSLLRYMSLSLTYNEALLFSDLSGNRALFGGVIFKISKKDKSKEKKEDVFESRFSNAISS